jgi:hypothetical protein
MHRLLTDTELGCFKSWLVSTPANQQNSASYVRWCAAQGAFDQKPAARPAPRARPLAPRPAHSSPPRPSAPRRPKLLMAPRRSFTGSWDLGLAYDEQGHPGFTPPHAPSDRYQPDLESLGSQPMEGDAELESVEAGQQGTERGPTEWETSRGRDALTGPGPSGRAPPFGPAGRPSRDEPMTSPAASIAGDWDEARAFLEAQGFDASEIDHVLRLAGRRDEPRPRSAMDRRGRIGMDHAASARSFAGRYGADAMRIKPLGPTGTRVFIR